MQPTSSCLATSPPFPQSVAGHRDLALHYHPEIQDYVDAARKERNVVLTGHSLGEV